MQKTAYCVRIRVWSSDVCSSDLRFDHVDLLEPAQQRAVLFEVIAELLVRRRADAADHAAREGRLEQVRRTHRAAARRARTEDRKSVVEGKSVSVRVDLGGRRIIKKKTDRRVTTITINREHNHYTLLK